MLASGRKWEPWTRTSPHPSQEPSVQAPIVAWAARRRDHTSAQRSVLIGLAGYLFASSLVDLYGFINQVVGIASVPSIALRVILGAVLVWLIPAHNGRQP